jgi:hypothetical protein
MKVHILSINVQGINKDTKVGVIRNYTCILSPRVDVLCLQEHKLGGDKVEGNIRTLRKSKNFWSLEASPSNKVEDKKIAVVKEGIALCFHPRLQPLILDKGSMAANKVQWIKFKRIEGLRPGILNIYASNMTSERCAR